jgi:UDP-N-acetyl-D-mannosaminuronate dehydrogenase
MGWDTNFAKLAEDASLTVGIIGLGYVGLPTAIGFHDAGFTVWGVDVSQRTVDMVLQGKKSNRRS